MRINYDYHLHSDFSGDCETPAGRMIERALELGLSGICFTEHLDLNAPADGPDFSLDTEAYFSGLSALQKQYRDRIFVGAGMEFGIQPGLSGVLKQMTEEYPFDFIIASLHFVRGLDPYYPSYFEGRDEEECYREFFQVQLGTLEEFDPDSWDTLGHMDYIVRYGPNRNRFYSYERYADVIDPLLRYVISHGKCLECNTGGLKYGLGEPNPCAGVLRRYRELGGELITIGADAHEPRHLAYDFERAAEILTSLGYRYYTVFEQRKARQIRIL